eukprot:111998-Chlamydomonas_euryale.AAC.1
MAKDVTTREPTRDLVSAPTGLPYTPSHPEATRHRDGGTASLTLPLPLLTQIRLVAIYITIEKKPYFWLPRTHGGWGMGDVIIDRISSMESEPLI